MLVCVCADWEFLYPDACRGHTDVSFEARWAQLRAGIPNFSLVLVKDEKMMVIQKTELGLRQHPSTERRRRGLNNKNSLLNTVFIKLYNS